MEASEGSYPSKKSKSKTIPEGSGKINEVFKGFESVVALSYAPVLHWASPCNDQTEWAGGWAAASVPATVLNTAALLEQIKTASST